MPFFLLSRDDNDELRLLTTTVALTKQDALAELSRLTADPGFDAWDTDVVLVDLDSATPVLMVRPAESAPAEPAPALVEGLELEAEPEPEPELELEPVPESEPEADLTVLFDDVYVAEADAVEDVVVEPLGVIPAEEAEAFAIYVASVGAEPGEAVSEESLPVPEMARELEPAVEPLLADFEPETGFAAVGEEAETDDLREALERTTAAMEQDALTGDVAEQVAAVAPAEVVIEKWPWDSVVQAEPASPASAAEPPVEDEAAEAAEAPVARPAAVSAFLEDLEPILSSPERSAEPALTEPVAEAPQEPAAVQEAEPEPEPEAVQETEPEPEPEPAPEPEQEPSLGAPQPEPVPEPMPEPAMEPIPTVDSYVCADCVYVDTCPNKNERLPKDCGSFQWK